MSDCATVRLLLPEAVYQGLDADHSAVVRRHLAACPACRAEFAALGEVRDALNAPAPEPTVHVNFGTLYREASRRQLLRLRRWRRGALASVAVAALLLAVFLLRLELRIEAQQLVLRWGAPPVPPEPLVDNRPAVVAPPRQAAPPEVTADDLRLVKRLIHALAAQQEMRDQAQTKEMLAVHQRLEQLRAQAEDRWEVIERYLSALQSTQSPLPRKED